MKERLWSSLGILQKGGAYIALFLLVGVGAMISPAFYKPRNIFNMLEQGSSLGVVSIGQTFVILGGGIDLSVASVMACTNIIIASLTEGRDEIVLPVIFLCLFFGSLIGLINGVFIVKRRVPAFIMTLGMMIILQGARFVYTKGAPYGYIPSIVRFSGVGRIGPLLPCSLIIFVIIAVLSYVILTKITFGRRLYCSGANEKAAYVTGVNTDLIKIITYVVSGFLAVVGGIILSGYLGTADNWAGKGYELDSIAAVVVGGTTFEGGVGGVIGTIAGVLLITIMSNLLLLLGLKIETQLIGKSIIIIAAVALYMRSHAKL